MKYTKIVFLLAAAGMFASCALTASFTSSELLTTDDAGHLKSDIVYDLGTAKYTFGADGSFLFQYYSYEGTSDLNNNSITNEGWMMTTGKKGTYVYTPTNFNLVLDYTQKFVASASSNWIDLTNNSDTIKEDMNYLLLQDKFFSYYQLYTADGENNWKTLYNKYMKSGAEQKGEYYCFIDPANNTIRTTSYNTTYNASGVITSSYSYIDSYTIQSIDPDGGVWKEGSTLTFNTLYTTELSGSTNNGTSWSAYTDTYNYYEYERMPYMNMSSYIIYLPSTYSVLIGK